MVAQPLPRTHGTVPQIRPHVALMREEGLPGCSRSKPARPAVRPPWAPEAASRAADAQPGQRIRGKCPRCDAPATERLETPIALVDRLGTGTPFRSPAKNRVTALDALQGPHARRTDLRDIRRRMAAARGRDHGGVRTAIAKQIASRCPIRSRRRRPTGEHWQGPHMLSNFTACACCHRVFANRTHPLLGRGDIDAHRDRRGDGLAGPGGQKALKFVQGPEGVPKLC